MTWRDAPGLVIRLMLPEDSVAIHGRIELPVKPSEGSHQIHWMDQQPCRGCAPRFPEYQSGVLLSGRTRQLERFSGPNRTLPSGSRGLSRPVVIPGYPRQDARRTVCPRDVQHGDDADRTRISGLQGHRTTVVLRPQVPVPGWLPVSDLAAGGWLVPELCPGCPGTFASAPSRRWWSWRESNPHHLDAIQTSSRWTTAPQIDPATLRLPFPGRRAGPPGPGQHDLSVLGLDRHQAVDQHRGTRGWTRTSGLFRVGEAFCC